MKPEAEFVSSEGHPTGHLSNYRCKKGTLEGRARKISPSIGHLEGCRVFSTRRVLWRAWRHNLPMVIRHIFLNMGQNSVLTSFTITSPYRFSKTHTSACLHVNTTHRWVEQSQKWRAWSPLPGAWRQLGKAAQWCLETETEREISSQVKNICNYLHVWSVMLSWQQPCICWWLLWLV